MDIKVERTGISFSTPSAAIESKPTYNNPAKQFNDSSLNESLKDFDKAILLSSFICFPPLCYVQSYKLDFARQKTT